jgi:hypothetical protein
MKARRILVAAIAGALALGAAAAAGGGAAGASTAGGTVIQPGTPNDPANAGGSQPSTISHNWSGYAVAAGKHQKFNYVHSTFVQPAITCSGKKDPNMSAWVGLDGFTSGTVEQEGTDAHCVGPGHLTPKYYAWYEMFPDFSHAVFPVHPGDVIDATTSYSGGNFTLTIADLTTSKSFTNVATCAECQRSSAEWIVERPALCSSPECTSAFLTRLPDFGTITMGGDEASVDGGPRKGISGFTNWRIYMVDNAPGGGFISLDGTSPLSASGEVFAVTWQREGNPYPITL